MKDKLGRDRLILILPSTKEKLIREIESIENDLIRLQIRIKNFRKRLIDLRK